MRVCLGGTFEPLHDGHRALLRAAVDGATHLFVGITSGKLAHRSRTIAPWGERAKRVEAEVRRLGFTGDLQMRELADAMGPAATGDYDRIVVSPETRAGAERINALRTSNGLRALEVRVVPHVRGADLLPISATALADGRIDEHGRRLVPVRIAVGSANGVKVAAVRGEMAHVLGPRVPFEVRGLAVASGVPEQPQGAQTMEGAVARARAAMAAWPAADYAIGIEAGLVTLPGSEVMEAQACAVLDRNGHVTTGWGPAFGYPPFVTRRAQAGEMVSTILGPVANDPRIGSTTGAIGYLTDGRLDRTGLSRMAVLMAFVPRFRADLYAGDEPGPAGTARRGS